MDNWAVSKYIAPMWTLALGVLLIAALISQRENKLASRLLALALAGIYYRQLVFEWKLSGIAFEYPWMLRSTFPGALLTTSVFYLYVKAMTNVGFRLGRKDFLHLLPFGFGLAWYLVFLCFAGPEYFKMGEPYLYEGYIRLSIRNIVKIPYIFAILRQVWIFQVRVKNHTSKDFRILANWLRLLVVGGLIFMTVDFASMFVGLQRPVWDLVSYATSVVTLSLGFFTLRYSKVFAAELVCEQQENKAKSGYLSQDQLETHSKKIREFIEKEKPHLNTSLRLSDLAESLSLKPYLLSEVINRGLNTNFYDLINSYRIESAKEILSDKKYSHLNLFGVALESGFNSKSVFNTTFKKATNMTPSQYRKWASSKKD